MDAIQVFVRLMYSPAAASGSIDNIAKEDQNKIKKLISQAKRLLLSLNLQMSLAKLEAAGE